METKKQEVMDTRDFEVAQRNSKNRQFLNQNFCEGQTVVLTSAVCTLLDGRSIDGGRHCIHGHPAAPGGLTLMVQRLRSSCEILPQRDLVSGAFEAWIFEHHAAG